MQVRLNSSLSKKELRQRLVLALYDINSEYTKLDNIDDELQTIEYEDIEIKETKDPM